MGRSPDGASGGRKLAADADAAAAAEAAAATAADADAAAAVYADAAASAEATNSGEFFTAIAGLWGASISRGAAGPYSGRELEVGDHEIQ